MILCQIRIGGTAFAPRADEAVRQVDDSRRRSHWMNDYFANRATSRHKMAYSKLRAIVKAQLFRDGK
jgi:hypothetical protein